MDIKESLELLSILNRIDIDLKNITDAINKVGIMLMILGFIKVEKFLAEGLLYRKELKNNVESPAKKPK